MQEVKVWPGGFAMKAALIVGYLIFLSALLEGAARFIVPLIANIYTKDITLTEQDREAIKSIIKGGKRYITYDRDLGWVPGKNVKADLYESNGSGIRSSREYTPKPIRSEVTRILAFGDSFTHSDDVSNKDSWTAILEADNNNLEVLNYGVPAYGIDQAYLRFQKESKKFDANIVLMGMMSENVYRHINTFRKFYQQAGGFPLGKPRFLEDDTSSIKLLPNWFNSEEKYSDLLTNPSATMREAGVHDYYFNNKPPAAGCELILLPCAFKVAGWVIREKIDRGQKDPWSGFLHYDMASEGPRLTIKIIRSFANSITENGMRPILVIFPNKTDYTQYKITRSRSYDPLIKASAEAGIETIDAMEAFLEHGRLIAYEDIFTQSSGHYSAAGNRRVAKWISEKLITKEKLPEAAPTSAMNNYRPISR